MARADMAGLFWDDTPPPKPPKKEKDKRSPPERTWERPDYLPNYEEALAFNIEVMDDMAFLEDLESLEAGKASILPSFCRRLLGAEQYESAKDMVRGKSGRVRPAELMELVQEILQAPSSAVVPVGESSAS